MSDAIGARHPVAELYQGEVLGEGLFNRMLADLVDPGQIVMVGAMLQLETETKARLRPALAPRGLPVREDPAARAQGEQVGAAMSAMTWRDKMIRLADGISDEYLPRYRALADAARPDDARITAFMVVHEQALLDAARCAADGDVEGVLTTLGPQLYYPLEPVG